MSALLLIPTNPEPTYMYLRIYRADTESGSYSLIDTVDAYHKEYEDADGTYSKYYKVTFSDLTLETAQISVKSFERQTINLVRDYLNISETDFSDINIVALIPYAKIQLVSDIAIYRHNITLTQIKDNYYSLPNEIVFDANLGGAVSDLDINLYTQETPVYEYTAKISEPITDISVDDGFIELSSEVASGYELSCDYWAVTRRIDSTLLLLPFVYKLAASYYDSLYANVSADASQADSTKIKVGDISISSGSSSFSAQKARIYLDAFNKMNAQYKTQLARITRGFNRVK